MSQDETVLLVREGEVEYIEGVPVPSSVAEPVPLICNVQPLGERDLEMLPEGNDFTDQFWLYVPPDQGIVPELNDKVIRAPHIYQVMAVRDWQTFQKVRIRRVDTGTLSVNLERYMAPV
jgi:hypothetical protein